MPEINTIFVNYKSKTSA